MAACRPFVCDAERIRKLYKHCAKHCDHNILLIHGQIKARIYTQIFFSKTCLLPSNAFLFVCVAKSQMKDLWDLAVYVVFCHIGIVSANRKYSYAKLCLIHQMQWEKKHLDIH